MCTTGESITSLRNIYFAVIVINVLNYTSPSSKFHQVISFLFLICVHKITSYSYKIVEWVPGNNLHYPVHEHTSFQVSDVLKHVHTQFIVKL